MNSLTSAYNRMAIPPKINPQNPEEVRKLRERIEKNTGGRSTIKTIGETQGMGIYGNIDPGGYGYTVVETEMEKQRRNPNSVEFRKEVARRKQESIDERMRSLAGRKRL